MHASEAHTPRLGAMEMEMDTNDVEVYARLADLLVQQTVATNRLCMLVEQLAGSITQLAALALRIEGRLDSVPGE
jgi:hypothetical protein